MKANFYSNDKILSQAGQILNIAEDAIICLDHEWNIILFNKGAQKVFGYKANEVLGKNLHILIPERYHENHGPLIHQFSKEKQKSRIMSRRSPVFALRKSGQEFPAEITISKTKVDKNKIYMAILRDITRIKNMEVKLQQANENLENKVTERTKQLQLANENLKKEIKARQEAQTKLEKEFQARLAAEKEKSESIEIVEKSTKLASIGVIAAGITHEINQPLNAIKVTTDSILYWEKRHKGEMPEFLINKLTQISNGANRINEIVYHMRSFWDSTKSTNQKINIKNTISKALSLIEHQLYSHGIEACKNFCTKDVFIKGNSIHLEQIIINLVVNSMHAIESSQKSEKYIEIKITSKNKKCILEVIDNGTGFAKDISTANLFDPFYSTKKESGMGLGLTIVKYFVEKLEGNIHLYNNDMGGATFCLELPDY